MDAMAEWCDAVQAAQGCRWMESIGAMSWDRDGDAGSLWARLGWTRNARTVTTSAHVGVETRLEIALPCCGWKDILNRAGNREMDPSPSEEVLSGRETPVVRHLLLDSPLDGVAFPLFLPRDEAAWPHLVRRLEAVTRETKLERSDLEHAGHKDGIRVYYSPKKTLIVKQIHGRILGEARLIGSRSHSVDLFAEISDAEILARHRLYVLCGFPPDIALALVYDLCRSVVANFVAEHSARYASFLEGSLFLFDAPEGFHKTQEKTEIIPRRPSFLPASLVPATRHRARSRDTGVRVVEDRSCAEAGGSTICRAGDSQPSRPEPRRETRKSVRFSGVDDEDGKEDKRVEIPRRSKRLSLGGRNGIKSAQTHEALTPLPAPL